MKNKLLEKLKEADIKLSVIRKGSVKKNVVFGINSRIDDIIEKVAQKTTALSIVDSNKMSKVEKQELKKTKVLIADKKTVREACRQEVERMRNAFGDKEVDIGSAAEEYGIYRTKDGKYRNVLSMPSGRQQQMISVLKRMSGGDWENIGSAEEPILIKIVE